MQLLVRDLNAIYCATPALYARDCDGAGFQWIEANDAAHSIYAWVRRGGPGDPEVVVVCNFTPVERSGWRMGFPQAGLWREVLNTDARSMAGPGAAIWAVSLPAGREPWPARPCGTGAAAAFDADLHQGRQDVTIPRAGAG